MFATVFEWLRALLGIVPAAVQAVRAVKGDDTPTSPAIPSLIPPLPDPLDAAAERAGTLSGVAAYEAGKKAGKK